MNVNQVRTAAFVALAMLAAACACGSRDKLADATPAGDGLTETGTIPECTQPADCTNSQAAKDIGRCGARDVWCQAGTCRGACRNVCETVSFEANSCGDDGLVCNQNEPVSQARLFYCTAIPIPCVTARDCPIYRPRTDAGVAAWECWEGVCRYPGFRYLIEM